MGRSERGEGGGGGPGRVGGGGAAGRRRGDQSIEASRLLGAASLPLLASTTVAEAASRQR